MVVLFVQQDIIVRQVLQALLLVLQEVIDHQQEVKHQQIAQLAQQDLIAHHLEVPQFLEVVKQDITAQQEALLVIA